MPRIGLILSISTAIISLIVSPTTTLAQQLRPRFHEATDLNQVESEPIIRESVDSSIGKKAKSILDKSRSQKSVIAEFGEFGQPAILEPQVDTMQPPARNEELMQDQVQVAMISSKVIAPASVDLNQKTTIRILLQNNSDAISDESRLKVTLPSHTRFVAAKPEPTEIQPGICCFDLSHFVARQQREIEIELIPTERRPIILSTKLTFSSSEQIGIAIKKPELELAIEGPNEAVVGQQLKHFFTIKNTGDGVARDVEVRINVPEGINTKKDGGLSILADTGTDSLEQLLPGQSKTLIMTSVVTQSLDGDIRFSVMNEEESIEVVKSLSANDPGLTVEASGPKRNFLNRDGIYSVAISNDGDADLKNVQVTASIPAGLDVTTLNRRGRIDGANRKIVWTFEQLSPGSEETIQFKARITQDSIQRCQIQVDCEGLASRQLEIATIVSHRADVNLAIECKTSEVVIEEVTKFELTLVNVGTESASNVAVEVELPQELQPLQSDEYTWNSATSRISFADFAITAGEQTKLQFEAAGTTRGHHVVKAILNCDGGCQISCEDYVLVIENEDTRVADRLIYETVR